MISAKGLHLDNIVYMISSILPIVFEYLIGYFSFVISSILPIAFTYLIGYFTFSQHGSFADNCLFFYRRSDTIS